MTYGRWLIDGSPNVSSMYCMHYKYCQSFWLSKIVKGEIVSSYMKGHQAIVTYYIIVQVILFDLNSGRYKLEEWRSELWDLSHNGIPDSDTESQDSLLFGQLTCWFISEVSIY